MSVPEIAITFLGSVLAAYLAVRYDQRLARRQDAADHLIEWCYRAGALASDSLHAWWEYQATGQNREGRDWQEDERRARLDYERYRTRLPEDLQDSIAAPASDLLTLLDVGLGRFPEKKMEQAQWHAPPPADLLEKGSPTHGQWMDALVEDIRRPLEAYCVGGVHPTSLIARGLKRLER